MLLEIVLIATIILILMGLIASTETVLANRGQFTKIDERMTDHRSRL